MPRSTRPCPTLDQADQSSYAKRRIFWWAVDRGRRAYAHLTAGHRIPWGLSRQLAAADRLVYRKVREALGGHLRFAISGGAPLAQEIGEFFYALGITILEGYGLTETSPVLTVNAPNPPRYGSVGTPLGACPKIYFAWGASDSDRKSPAAQWEVMLAADWHKLPVSRDFGAVTWEYC